MQKKLPPPPPPAFVVRKRTRYVWRGFIIRLIILFFIGLLSVAGFYGYKLYRFQKKVIQENPGQLTVSTTEGIIQGAKSLIMHNKAPLRGEERERVNVLLLGMGGEGHSGKYLTDTIMLASINPKTYQSALLSIPRDLYVEVPEYHVYTKINAVFAYGMMRSEEDTAKSIGPVMDVVTEVTGQPVDYYVILNFNGFEQIINEIGGVDVEVKEDILDKRYPGPNFSYTTFEISKGFQHMDGETALKYARVRHTMDGDFGRAERQQQILAATKKKAMSLGTVLNPARLGGLIDALGDNLKTNVQIYEIPSFIEYASNINIYESTNEVLDAWNPDSLLASTHKQLGGVAAYVLLPRARNYSQIHELAKNIFDFNLIERKKKSIEEEDAALTVLLRPRENFYKIKPIFTRLGYKKINVERMPKEMDCTEKTKLYNNSDTPKMFTLDDLVTKLEAEVVDQLLPDMEGDIVICLAEDAVEYFYEQNEKQEDEDQQLKDQSVLDEKGEVRVNEKGEKKKKK